MGDQNIIDIAVESGVDVVSFNVPTIGAACGVDLISKQIRDHITDNKPKNLIIDFDGVKFFSSQMLGILVDTWRRLRQYDAEIIISGINPQLGRVFKITNIDKIFKFYPDRQTAIDAVKERKAD